jgi:hypothetical protein
MTRVSSDPRGMAAKPQRHRALRRTMARLPESAVYACLAGAVAGALTSTGLWEARRSERAWGAFRALRSPGAALAAASLLF